MRNESVYRAVIKDNSARYFTCENYGIKNDGVFDVSEKLQEAINSIALETGYGTIFIPEGRYLISRTIYIPKAIRVIGYGNERPEFILKDHAADFDKPKENDKGGYRYMFWFVDKVVTDENAIEDSNPGTFYSAMSNVNISLGNGNPYAVALRTHYAQHAFISNMIINVMSGMAGIYDVGNEMENISINGGNYAIITTKCSPGWPFLMVDTYFEGQKKAAIRSREAGLTIVRNQTVHTPKFLEVEENFFEKLYMENCVLTDISEFVLDIAMDENALTQIHFKNVLCKNIGKFARYRDSGKKIDLLKEGMVNYIHGTVVRDDSDIRRIVDDVDVTEPVNESELLRTNIKYLPEVSEWVNVSDLGIIGDGKTDVTEQVKDAINTHKVLFFPGGEYIFTDSLELKRDTVIIGMHPYTTRFILRDNSESFTGFGGRRGFVITPPDGKNIINGIGVQTGGRNPRAIAVLWQSGADSYANDIKLIGGHGNLVKGTGAFDNPYNESRTADKNLEQMWDAQYPSFLVKNGGGTFKDIWSASTYATSGFQVEDSDITSHVYCMSLEHHQRVELRLINVSNWNFYAIQTEEELAEGEYALPIELVRCNNIRFNIAYFFRTVFVKTPFDYCVKCYDSENIEFNSFQNVTQMKYTFTQFLKNCSTDREIRTWQAAKAIVTNHIEIETDDENRERVNIIKKYDGFRFADGGITDAEGNFYFIDSLDKRAYKIDGQTLKLELVFESPIKINSLACDTEDHLIYIGEYVIPKDATIDGVPQENILPVDSYGTSYGYWYNKDAVIVAFTQDKGDITPLECVPIGSIRPELVYYPGNRWRDGGDFRDVVKYNPGNAFIAPDGKTIIPCHYDLIRANNLSKARPGSKLYSVDEAYKRVYACEVLENGLMDSPRPVFEKGDFCVVESADKLFVCEDDITVTDLDGRKIKSILTPKRPTTIGLDGKGENIKYITTRHEVYVVECI